MFAAAADFIRGIWRIFPPVMWAIIGGVMACVIVGAVCYHSGRSAERRDQEAARLAANMAALARDAAAKETAAAERMADAARTDKLTEELRNAVQALPDDIPSDRRRALACARLRQQGTDTTAIPACR